MNPPIIVYSKPATDTQHQRDGVLIDETQDLHKKFLSKEAVKVLLQKHNNHAFGDKIIPHNSEIHFL